MRIAYMHGYDFVSINRFDIEEKWIARSDDLDLAATLSAQCSNSQKVSLSGHWESSIYSS